MVSSPSAASSEKKNEQKDKKKDEARKLQRKKENKILKHVGISKMYETFSSKRHRIEMPPRTEQAIIELLASPHPKSPLSPDTDMSPVPLTLLSFSSGMLLPVLDSFHL